MFCVFQYKYVNVAQVSKFHDESLTTLNDFFFNQSNHKHYFVKAVQCASSGSSCFSAFLYLQSPTLSWVSLVLPVTAAVKTCSRANE